MDPNTVLGTFRQKGASMVTHTEDEVLLKECFERNGCLRIREDDPARGRHGGVELRVVVSGNTEKREVLKALRRLAIHHGRAYEKQRGTHRYVIPIYTRRDIVAFLNAVRPKGYAAMARRVMASAIRPLKAPKKTPKVRDRCS